MLLGESLLAPSVLFVLLASCTALWIMAVAFLPFLVSLPLRLFVGREIWGRSSITAPLFGGRRCSPSWSCRRSMQRRPSAACGALASPARATRIELQPNPKHRERDAEGAFPRAGREAELGRLSESSTPIPTG